jgi:hypothetical protein
MALAKKKAGPICAALALHLNSGLAFYNFDLLL